MGIVTSNLSRGVCLVARTGMHSIVTCASCLVAHLDTTILTAIGTFCLVA